jgi:hypothetical protein
MRIGKKYTERIKLYKYFSREYINSEAFDFSEEAIKEVYLYESQGIGDCNIHNRFNGYLETGRKQNGYACGKSAFDITVSMWRDAMHEIGWRSCLDDIEADEGLQFPIVKDVIKSLDKYAKSIRGKNE